MIVTRRVLLPGLDGVSTYQDVEIDLDPAIVAAEANEATLQARAQVALATNLEFLDLASPTNAQALAQIRLLTRECNGLIRLALRLLDSVDGT